MIVYRISKQQYALNRTGTGARLSGGRWNSEGLPAIYTGLTVGVCALEKLVHTGNELPDDLVLLSINLPDNQDLYVERTVADLPAGWDALPSSALATEIGDDFLNAGQSLGLIVPSSIAPEERNLIINPFHPAFKEAEFKIMRPFMFDERLRPEQEPEPSPKTSKGRIKLIK